MVAAGSLSLSLYLPPFSLLVQLFLSFKIQFFLSKAQSKSASETISEPKLCGQTLRVKDYAEVQHHQSVWKHQPTSFVG